jgi:hypothetical protein
MLISREPICLDNAFVYKFLQSTCWNGYWFRYTMIDESFEYCLRRGSTSQRRRFSSSRGALVPFLSSSVSTELDPCSLMLSRWTGKQRITRPGETQEQQIKAIFTTTRSRKVKSPMSQPWGAVRPLAIRLWSSCPGSYKNLRIAG